MGAFTCVGWQVTHCDPIWQVADECNVQKTILDRNKVTKQVKADIHVAVPGGNPTSELRDVTCHIIAYYYRVC